MKYSLITVLSERNGLVDGNWIQDVTGELKDAIACARATERANSNRITVAVVPELAGCGASAYDTRTGLRRLDT